MGNHAILSHHLHTDGFIVYHQQGLNLSLKTPVAKRQKKVQQLMLSLNTS